MQHTCKKKYLHKAKMNNNFYKFCDIFIIFPPVRNRERLDISSGFWHGRLDNSVQFLALKSDRAR